MHDKFQLSRFNNKKKCLRLADPLNYKSKCSEKYKKDVLINLLRRGYKTSSSIEIFN